MSGRPFYLPFQAAVKPTNIGVPGAQYFFRAAGTTTLQNIYSAPNLVTPLPNPLTADGAGRIPDVWLNDTLSWRVTIYDQTGTGTPLFDRDPYIPGTAPDAADLAPYQAASEDAAAAAAVSSASASASAASATAAQAAVTIALANANMPTSNVVDVKWFGAAGTGLVDDTASAQSAVDYFNGLGGGTVIFPEGTYKIAGLVLKANVKLLGFGAIITSASTSSAATVSVTGAAATIDGIHFKLTGGSATPWHVDVTAANCTIQNCVFEKDEGTGGYQGYFRPGADNLKYTNNRTLGSNGFYLEASNAAFLGNRFIARASGGDDAIAIKSYNGVVHSIRFEGNHYENHANFVAIGSEIGTPGANDATHSKGVRGIVMTGNTGKNCTYGLFIKPGSNSSADYRDGFVNDVVFSNNVMEDLTGAAFNNMVHILASRGQIVSNIRGRNNTFRGRTNGTEAGGLKAGVLIRTADSATGNTPSVSGIDIEAVIIDPYNGAAFGTAGVPGYPVVNVAHVKDETAAFNAISDIRLSLSGNGTSESAIVIQSQAGSVTLDKAFVTNANMSGFAGNGGVYSDVSYTIGEYSFTLGGGTNFAGTGAVLRKWIDPRPASSATPANNGDMVFELTSNTSLKVKVKGSDGTVRSATLTLS